MRLRGMLVCVLCLGLALNAVADTLTLKNGQVLEGYFVGGNANGVTFVGQDGTSRTYPLSEVASMSYGPVQAPAPKAAAFWPVYKEYAAAQKQLGDQKLAIIQDYAKEFLTMNDAKANDLAQRVMALDDQRTALRNKYYDAMKKVLPMVLVVRFFQLDGQIQMLIDLQIASNLPIIEELPAKE
jgi:hypothetical protein